VVPCRMTFKNTGDLSVWLFVQKEKQ
jgi:hypothetical protein